MGVPGSKVRRPGRQASFQRDVLGGLSGPQKSLPSKYFYDERGSRLFAEICTLEEYYLTRTECEILRRHLPELSGLLGARVRVIEPGAGSGIKTEMLLAALEAPASYVPIDVSDTALAGAVERLGRRFPGLEILPVVADFLEPFDLSERIGAARRDVVFFPGSTIGNLVPSDARRFLRSMVRATSPSAALVLGVDLKKEAWIVERAYNDVRGVTADFNLNLLRRINRELGADFRLDAFRHLAFYDAVRGRVEMHLVSDSSQRIHFPEATFGVEPGETILTEYSHKYSPAEFGELCRGAGLEIVRGWTDPRGWVGVYLCVPRPG
jgi:L-histidine N-alpha-methyltransferase